MKKLIIGLAFMATTFACLAAGPKASVMATTNGVLAWPLNFFSANAAAISSQLEGSGVYVTNTTYVTTNAVTVFYTNPVVVNAYTTNQTIVGTQAVAVAGQALNGLLSTNQYAALKTIPYANRMANGGLPPMGYITYNAYPYPSANPPTEAKMLSVLLRMKTNGLYDLGYKYLVIDEGWQWTREGDGTLGFNTNFPNGVRPVIDYAHSLGMKLGLYFFTSPFANGGSPGSHGYWREDAAWAVTNGVDYIKLEGFDIPASPYSSYMFQSVIQESGRDIYTCIGGDHFEPWMRTVGNSWRYAGSYGDINSWGETVNWWTASLSNNWGNGFGQFNEMDEITWNIFSKTRVSMAAILPAPILISELVLAGNPSDLEAHKDNYTNTTVIAINQDGGHHPGFLVSRSNSVDIVQRPLGDIIDGKFAVLAFNRNNYTTNFSLYFTNFGLSASAQMLVEDAWNGTNHTATGSFSVSLGISTNDVGVQLFRISPVATNASTFVTTVTDWLTPAELLPDGLFTLLYPPIESTLGGNVVGWGSTNAVGFEHRITVPVTPTATNATVSLRMTCNRADEQLAMRVYFSRFNNDDTPSLEDSQTRTINLTPGRVDTITFTGPFANTNVGKSIAIFFEAGTNTLQTRFYILDAVKRVQKLAE